MKYCKTAQSNADLLARWQAKGLQVPNPDAAQRALTFIGYFRLRGYALPLMRTEPDVRHTMALIYKGIYWWAVLGSNQ